MDIRHLRYFVVLAEELHFARAAERLHTDQSPLSRTIKELEERLEVRLFDRSRHRGTQLTLAGQTFLKHVRRIFAALELAKHAARAAAMGRAGSLSLAVSDGVAQPKLAALLALSREEDPSVDIHVMEVPLTEQLRGLRDGTFDAGFARDDTPGEDIRSYPLWQEDVLAVVPSRHPLLAYSEIPLGEFLKYPMIVSNPDMCQGYERQIDRVLQATQSKPNVVERTATVEMTLTLVAAGYGVGFIPAGKTSIYRYPEVTTRPLAIDNAKLTTHLFVKFEEQTPERLDAFVERTIRISRSLGTSTFNGGFTT